MVSSFFPGISILPRHCSACNHMQQNVPILSIFIIFTAKQIILSVELSHAQKQHAADYVVSYMHKSNMLQTML